jgi:3-deoxy-7-phosphoheptulonate synthase
MESRVGGVRGGEDMPRAGRPEACAPPYPLASRHSKPTDTVIPVLGAEIGGPRFVVIAGPCAVENPDQLLATAFVVKEAGATVLRGSAIKPRSSPYSFQGLGEEGLKSCFGRRGW